MEFHGASSTWSEQVIIMNGVKYSEKKEVHSNIDREGNERNCTISHSRTIGDKTVTTKQVFKLGEEKEKTVETEMTHDELIEFEKLWSRVLFKDKEQPMILKDGDDTK